MKSRKMILMNIFAGQQWRNRLREQTYGHQGRDGGGGGRREWVRCMDRVTWKLTVPYVKYIASENLPYDSGNTNRGSVTI